MATTKSFSLSNRLKEIRLFRGYTSAEHASRFIQIGRSQYTKYEQGANMGVASLFKILHAWGIKESNFFSGNQISEKDFSEDCPANLKDLAAYLYENLKIKKALGEKSLSIEDLMGRPSPGDPQFKFYIHLDLILRFNDSIAQKQLMNELRKIEFSTN